MGDTPRITVLDRDWHFEVIGGDGRYLPGRLFICISNRRKEADFRERGPASAPRRTLSSLGGGDGVGTQKQLGQWPATPIMGSRILPSRWLKSYLHAVLMNET